MQPCRKDTSTDYTVCFTAEDGTDLQAIPAAADLTTTTPVASGTAWGTVGVVGTDRVTLNGTGTFAVVDVGIAVTSSATLRGVDAAKYTLSQPTGLTGPIRARPVTVAAAAESKTFGAPDPTLTYRITSGSLVIDSRFTGALTPACAGGRVTFLDGTKTLGQVVLTDGRAALTTATLAPGSHRVAAVYGGDANHRGSTSASLSQVVKTTVTIAITPTGLAVQVDGTSYRAPIPSPGRSAPATGSPRTPIRARSPAVAALSPPNQMAGPGATISSP